MLYVSARQNGNYAVTDTLDGVTEWISEDILTRLQKSGGDVYGVAFVEGKLRVKIYPDLQSIITEYTSRYAAMGKKCPFEFRVFNVHDELEGDNKDVISDTEYYTSTLIGTKANVIDLCEYYSEGTEYRDVVIPDFVERISNMRGYGDEQFLGTKEEWKADYIGAFDMAHIKTIVFSKRLLQISNLAFTDADIRGDVVIPDSIKVIADSAFMNTRVQGNFLLPQTKFYAANYSILDCEIGGKLGFTGSPDTEVKLIRKMWMIKRGHIGAIDPRLKWTVG